MRTTISRDGWYFSMTTDVFQGEISEIRNVFPLKVKYLIYARLFSLDVDGSQFYQSPQHDVSVLFVSFTYKLTQNMDSGLCLWLVFDRCDQSKLETKLVLILPAMAKDAVQYKRPAEFENMLICGHVTTPVDMNEVPPQIRSQEPDQDTREWKTR